MGESKEKKHRAPRSGAKAQKKNRLENRSKAQSSKGFAVQHTTKAARKVRKTLDKETKKYRLPTISSACSIDCSPPLIVGIVGPPRCGKSTLLRGLIRHFGRQLVPNITGPITVVVGKKFRLTLIECDCNINSMIDVAKIADLVLLVVNVSKGLEMYHFEFINMLQVHGMPRVIPVLTHLDQFKESASSRALRKKVKQRLWTDLSAKIFLLSRFVQKKFHHHKQSEVGDKIIDGDYMPAEIQRLARLMVVKSPRPSDWRTGHPYMLVDRLEDVTSPRILAEDEKASRVISLYGWVRGAPIETSFSNPLVHIPGLGDFPILECTRQQDPCPTPAQLMRATPSTEGTVEAKLKKRLSEGERKLYAPMSSVGGVLLDRDATYIDLGGSHHLGGGRLTSGRQVVVGAGEAELAKARDLLSAAGHDLDERLKHDHRVQMLTDAPLLEPFANGLDDFGSDENDDDSSETDVDIEVEEDGGAGLRVFEDTVLPDVENEPMDVHGNDSGDENSLRIKGDLLFSSRHRDLKNAFDNLGWEETATGRKNWKRIIYNAADDETPKETGTSALTGEMFIISTTVDTLSHGTYADDVTLSQQRSVSIDWTASTALIANCFTTGEWNSSEDAEQLLAADAKAQRAMEELKAQKIAKAVGGRVQYKPEGKLATGVAEDSDVEEDEVLEEEFEDFGPLDEEGGASSGDNKEEDNNDPTKGFEKALLRPTKHERILEKRRRHKELFDRLYEAAQRGSGTNADEPATAFYDKMVAKTEAQQQLNREILGKLAPGVRETVEGVPPGSYVRLQIVGVPYQFMANFDPRQPLVVGGLVKGEETKAFIQARFQAHRWIRHVLKSNDPITVSVGWRRYQTIGVFSKEEHNFRKRYLKYALAHEHCHITFYGPVVPPKTGVVAIINSTWREQAEAPVSPKFRIAGTGSVTDCNESFQIMKKLKLVGHPYKIFSKTAFIRGMFNSELEVAKMVGSKIQTVSKVRGLIKNALTGTSHKPGDFRATFEASIRMADIVFARTFVPIELTPFYNPIPNLLLPSARTAASSASETQWRMLRTTSELRWDMGAKVEIKEDSKYREAQRVPFVHLPLTVPTKLVAALPFADKPKLSKKQLRTQRFRNDEVRRARNVDVPAPIIASSEVEGVPDPVGHVRDRAQLIQRLRRLHAAYQEREKGKMVARISRYKAKRATEEEMAEARSKKRKKEFFARHRGGTKGHSAVKT
ncbi:ribosome biolocus tagsis protein BMS1 [Echinococcus multilocularis]|uniref:Ribosome biolocus tagsis protein BMS1 n=1 Tax=Echinococcus multilocularis TaxID=6211 RepID=A0A068YHQ4_ECHMU|nr:ribosome biolocus tagsis protein BMS1 [Echinococcus multilocularis]